jgi:hypothetical protein
MQRMQNMKTYDKEKYDLEKKAEYDNRRRKHEMTLTKRLEKSIHAKKQEAQHLRKELKQSLQFSREIIQQDTDSKLQYFRENHVAHNFQSSNSNVSTISLSSGIVDDNSSTLINVPIDIVTRMKTAKR